MRRVRPTALTDHVVLNPIFGLPVDRHAAAAAGAGGALADGATAEDGAERPPKLSAHDAVEDKVDGAVDQHDDVPDVAERVVDVDEDVVVDAAEERERALRQLGDDEAEHDGEQHRGRPVVLGGALRLGAAALRREAAPLLLGAPHRAQQQAAERREEDARRHLERDTVQPEVEHAGVRRERALRDPVAARVRQQHDVVHHVVRRAADDGGRDDGDDGDARAPHVAEARAVRRVAHDDVAEERERDGEPHGARVARDDEVGVEDEVDDPAARVVARGRRRREAVEVEGVRQVGEHREQVSGGERRQQVVGGGEHVAARQHDDVHRVHHDAKRAHEQADVAVHALVPHVEALQRLRRRGRRRVVRPYGVARVGQPGRRHVVQQIRHHR